MLISATLSGKRYLTVKHKFGTASKINMIVSFSPFNFERASVHHDLTAAACHSELCRRNSRGTCPGAACHRYAASSLPHPCTQRVFLNEMGKLYITACRESLVMLQQAPVGLYVGKAFSVREYHEMRITHRHKRALRKSAEIYCGSRAAS